MRVDLSAALSRLRDSPVAAVADGDDDDDDDDVDSAAGLSRDDVRQSK